MGIVVCSRQVSNIFWHGVTRLNAICVLISSLQQLCPLERRGVRWFPPTLFCFLLCLYSFCGSLFASISQHAMFFFSFLSSLFVLALSCFTVYFIRRKDSFQQLNRHTGDHSFMYFCLSTLDQSVQWMPTCCRFDNKWNNWEVSSFCPNSYVSSSFYFPILSSGPLRIEPAAVFIWVRNHLMYMTPGQNWQTEREDEGRWWRTPTHCLWRQTPLSFLFQPSLYYILIGWLMYRGNPLWMQNAGGFIKGR